MSIKQIKRTRRAQRTRQKIRSLGDRARLSIHISGQHIYAQIFSSDGSRVIASASTLDKEVANNLAKKGVNKENAATVGATVAKRALSAGVEKVGFDRSGFKYHGRVKALAEAARASGLIF